MGEIWKHEQTVVSRGFVLRGGGVQGHQAFTLTTGNRKLRRTATNKPKSRKAHTFSLEWNSRDFLLARTWMWLDTCRVGEGRKTKEEPVTMAMKSPLQLGKARRTLMAAWISRTFFLAKTCMWLDTSIQNRENENKQEKPKRSKFLLSEELKEVTCTTGASPTNKASRCVSSPLKWTD